MDPMVILTTITTVLDILVKVTPTVVSDINSLRIFATTLFERLSGNPITPEQRAAVEAQIDYLSDQFQAPIPPESEQ